MTSDAGVPGAPRFDVVRRGYDRQQVDEHVARLHRVIARMRADLMARSQQQALPPHDVGHGARMHPGAPQRPGAESPDAIGGFTDRMQSILQSAEEEAEEIRSKARLAAKAELDGIKYQREAMLAELAQVRHQIDGLRTRGPLPDGGGQPDRGPRPPMPAADAPRGVVPRPRPRPHPSAPGPQGNAGWSPGQNPMREQPPRRPVDPQQPEPSRTGIDAVTTAPSGPVPARPDQAAPAAVPVPSFRIVGSTPQQPASPAHPAGDATAVRPAAGVPDPRSADPAAPTPPAGPPRSSGAETVLLLKPQSAQARADAPPSGQGDHNGDGAAGALAAGKPDRTDNGARNGPGGRAGNGAGNGSVDHTGNGTTAGPGNGAAGGSGSATTAASGNGTTAGSGNVATAGPGSATTAGSSRTTTGSGSGSAGGSGNGTAAAGSKTDADGTPTEADSGTGAGPVGTGEDATTSGPAATGDSTDAATQRSSSDLGVDDADPGRAAKPISMIRLTRSNRGGTEPDDKTRDAGSSPAKTSASEDTVAVPAWSPTAARKTSATAPDEVPEQGKPSGKPDGGASSYGSGRSPSTSRSG